MRRWWKQAFDAVPPGRGLRGFTPAYRPWPKELLTLVDKIIRLALG